MCDKRRRAWAPRGFFGLNLFLHFWYFFRPGRGSGSGIARDGPRGPAFWGRRGDEGELEPEGVEDRLERGGAAPPFGAREGRLRDAGAVGDQGVGEARLALLGDRDGLEEELVEGGHAIGSTALPRGWPKKQPKRVLTVRIECPGASPMGLADGSGSGNGSGNGSGSGSGRTSTWRRRRLSGRRPSGRPPPRPSARRGGR
jgi:hypothetical protein